MAHDGPTPPKLPLRMSNVRSLFGILSPLFALFAVLVIGRGLYVFATNDFPNYGYGVYSAYLSRAAKVHFANEAFALFAAFSILPCLLFILSRVPPRTHRAVITELQADSLSERAMRARSALQEATSLARELTDELAARSALLEDVERQLAAESQRAEDMKRLDKVDEDTTRIINKYFDEALKRRLDDLERNARRREWGLAIAGGLIIGLIVGIASILIAHFLFGF